MSNFSTPNVIDPTPEAFRLATFTYAARNTTIPISSLRKVDQLIIDGTIPTALTVVNMPTHQELLSLFDNPVIGDLVDIVLVNTQTNSINLTQSNPSTRVLTVSGSSIIHLHLYVKNATNTDGTAEVTMSGVADGGTYSITASNTKVPAYFYTQKISGGLPVQINLSDMIGAIRITTLANFLLQNEYVSVTAGESFAFSYISTNSSGVARTWTANEAGQTIVPITPAVVAQPDATTYMITLQFNILGVTPTWVGSTLNIELVQLS